MSCVITSYSIHYTKLYECELAIYRYRPGQGRAPERHGGMPGRSGQKLLLSGDEHPFAGIKGFTFV